MSQRGINENLFHKIEQDTDWTPLALAALRKKTNGNNPEEMKEILKVKNFLNYRGFEFQDIDKAFSILYEEKY